MKKLTRMLTCISFVVAAAVLSAGCEREKSGSSAPGTDGGGQPVDVPAATTADCVAATTADCVATQQQIDDLEKKIDDALAKNDAKSAAQLSLQRNKQVDLLSLYKAGAPTPEALNDLESKYEQLGKLVDSELNRPVVTPTDAGAGSEPGTGTGTDDGSGAGTSTGTGSTTQIPTDPRLPSVVYHPLEIQAVAEVVKDFGDLYINETPKSADGRDGAEELKIDTMPWAGYWYPKRGTELFEGDAAPLAKLDKAMAKAGREGHAVAEEKKFRSGSDETWEGLCMPWARAAIATLEPRASRVVNGVEFTPNDQKALITKLHEQATSRVYGVRYNGNSVTDGTIQDIRPEAFHRIVLKQLGELKKPFAIDTEPGPEVWAEPLYRMRWTVRKDPEKIDAFIVRALPYLTRYRNEIRDDFTTGSDRHAPAYEYRLYVDPQAVQNGKFKVIAGEWINDSRESHPDTVVIAVDDNKLGSKNAGINEALDVVRQIIGVP